MTPLVLPLALLAAAPPDAAAVHAAVERHLARARPAVVLELAGFLALPNLASDGPAIRGNADRLLGMLEARGIAARLLETAGGPPVVYGERRTPGARRTVLFYAHYDGQPVHPADW